ncbi:MAG: hypothetical protein IJN68_02590 [Clostridia bacterium]|nr:hypothetical protein [Clostridia bacterium]
MNFFDSLIDDVYSLIEGKNTASTDYEPDAVWNDTGYSEVILQRDTAFELEGTGFNLVTSQPLQDRVIVVGENLGEIIKERSFARISLVQIENEEDQQKAYNLIRKIEYVKYHTFPEGYMMRTTSRSHKEAVRVAKSALKKEIDFQKVGSLLIKKYKEIPAVKGVTVVFVTDSSADYGKLSAIAVKSNAITETLNHVVNSVNFDCDTCNLKTVCDEVEGMKELHFRNASKGM